MKNLILIGFMGAGKTSVGKALTKKMGMQFVDTDERIEKEQGKKIPDIFSEYGEAYFRDLETKLLKDMLTDTKGSIISVGGGMPIREENQVLLRKLGCVCYLCASKETILSRVSNDGNRPMLNGENLEQKVDALMKSREKIYEQVAHLNICTDGCDISQVVQMILQEKRRFWQ